MTETEISSGSKSSILEKDEIPLPMDSVEGFQEFANGNALNLSNQTESDPVTSPKNEGWFSFLRWIPTSPTLLEESEKKILSYVKTSYVGSFVDIGSVQKPSNCKWTWSNRSEERKIWTLVFGNNKESEENVPLVLVHGLCASAGLWALNIDSLAQNRKVYAIDLLGFGRSSRIKFSSDPSEAESQHVEALENWRSKLGLSKFILCGHSMGGFISSSYALKYPENVSSLVLADPWGYPPKPENVEEVLPIKKSIKGRAISTIGQKINPLSLIRVAGPYGPKLIGRARPDLVMKFTELNQGGRASISEYIYHCNAQNPTGEEAFRVMMDFFGWAKNPMHSRLVNFHPQIPLTMIYGEKTWLQQLPKEDLLQILPPNSTVDVHTIENCGHHVYADNLEEFNKIVNKVGKNADLVFKNSNYISP